METQSFLGGHILFFGNLVIVIDLGQDFKYMPALIRKALPYLDKASATMSQTISQ
jgi:hypothetical protein